MHDNLEERLKLIDRCLYFYGQVSRSMLETHFGVGPATASRTLKAYQESCPENAQLQKGKTGGYFITDNFTPGFTHSAAEVLELLCYGTITTRLQLNTYGPGELIGVFELDEKLVASITRAMVKNGAVKIQYLSGTSGHSDRTIYPKKVFQGGGAWYLRAFDELHNEYRTFRFSRVINSEEVKRKTMEGIDQEWSEDVILSIGPHDKHPNPEAHARDLGLLGRPVINLKSNHVVAGFLLTDLRVDCSEFGDLNPFEYPLRLMNRKDILHVPSLSFAPGFKK